MPKDEISCVIPVFDGARYVAAAIRSALAQTRPPDEIIVVDDGSRDDTAKKVACFGTAVTYVHQPHAGVAAARNRGVERASGNLLAFLDADDRWHPERLRRQLDALAGRPNVELCDAESAYFWSEELGADERERDPRYPHSFWHDTKPGHIGTWLVRRTAFARVGPFDPALRFSEDTDWLLRFGDGGGVRLTLREVLNHRRLHHRNMTAADRHVQVRALARTLKLSRDRRRGAGPAGREAGPAGRGAPSDD